MKAIAIILNMIFFPGVGTMIAGKVGIGVTQIVLAAVGCVMVLTGGLAFVGIPLIIGVWIWALASAIGSNTTEDNEKKLS